MSGRPFSMGDDPDATRIATTQMPAREIGPGSVLSHTYRIEKLLSRGGMGEVFLARHIELGTQHAVKVIRPDMAEHEDVAELFRREAGLLRSLRHDGVVAYDGVFRDEAGRLFLVMEFVDGPSLKKVLEQRAFSVDECFRLRDRMAAGLQALHERGIVHRDISPDNVILEHGELERAKLIDLGIAKQADSAAATIIGNSFAGKLAWASPEQLGMFGGQVDARSDIYSFGLVIAACALGRSLQMGTSQADIIRARYQVPDLSEIPEALRPGLRMMLQPDPADRPSSIAELLAAAASPASGGSSYGGTERRGAAATTMRGGRDGPTMRTELPERQGTVRGGTAIRGVPTARTGRPAETAKVKERRSGAGGWILAILTTLLTLGGFLAAYLYFLEPHYQYWTQIFGTPPPWPEQQTPVIEERPPATIAQDQPVTPTIDPRLFADQPVETPPIQTQPETPPVETPPVETPPVESPVDTPPVVVAPVVVAPVETPPVETPPIETQPVVEQPVVPPVETPPAIDIAAINTGLAGIAAEFSCADLSATLATSGGATVAGFVASQADKDRLVRSLAGLSGLTVDPNAIQVFEGPFCRTIHMLRQETAVGDAAAGAPVLSTTAGKLVFANGETLALQVGATSANARFLHVAYLDHQGNVLNMYQSNVAQAALTPGQTITLDSYEAGGQSQKFIIGPPFGTDLIIAIASPRPLFQADRPVIETADAFLPALDAALRGVGAASNFVFVTTRERG